MRVSFPASNQKKNIMKKTTLLLSILLLCCLPALAISDEHIMLDPTDPLQLWWGIIQNGIVIVGSAAYLSRKEKETGFILMAVFFLLFCLGMFITAGLVAHKLDVTLCAYATEVFIGYLITEIRQHIKTTREIKQRFAHYLNKTAWDSKTLYP